MLIVRNEVYSFGNIYSDNMSTFIDQKYNTPFVPENDETILDVLVL